MPSSVRLLRSATLTDVVPYAYAATAPKDARLLFLAGACPLDEHGRVVAVGDHAAQAARCMETVVQVLSEAEATLADVLFVRVLVASADRRDLSTVWDVVHSAFGDHEPPGTLQGVTVLGWERQLVEVEVVAAVVA
ncbi:MAG: RidA family protein [Amnibacterium sp.]